MVDMPIESKSNTSVENSFVLPTPFDELAVDAEVMVSVANDGMQASVMVSPPKNGGREVDLELLHVALAKAGVCFGLDQESIISIAEGKLYQVETVVARGKKKRDGVDAIVEELYPRHIEIRPKKLEDGTVDFKNLNLIRDIPMGQLLVRRTPATSGEDGMRVDGRVVKAVNGRDVKIFEGENTKLIQDGNELYSTSKGHLSFSSGRFNVLTRFVVDGNVDNTTGDLDFSGDIYIKGDILEGYTVTANGNVTVEGGVNGGIIFANGDVIVNGGFNGMTRGNISSGKTIKAKFLQNCKASAKENIVTEAVINSIVNCDGDLLVSHGKGAIIGGKCNVLHRVEAREIGSESNTPTQVNIGVSAEIIKEKLDLESEISEINSENELIVKNLEFVDVMLERGDPPEKYAGIKENCSKQKATNMLKLAKLTKRFNELEELILNSGYGSEVRASKVYPSTKISIGNSAMLIRIEQIRVVFRLNSNSELYMASY